MSDLSLEFCDTTTGPKFSPCCHSRYVSARVRCFWSVAYGQIQSDDGIIWGSLYFLTGLCIFCFKERPRHCGSGCLLYPECAWDAGNELLSSSLSLAPSLPLPPFFPVPCAEAQAQGEEAQVLVLPFLPLSPLPPAPDHRWKGHPLPLPAGQRVAAFPSLSPTFPVLCPLPWGMGCREHGDKEMKNVSV